MKLVLILIFAGMFQISASVYSQKTKMSFTMTDKSVKEVLDYIQDKTEFRFFYNEDFTDLNRKVSLNLKETGIEDVLDTLLSASDVTYKVLDNNLIVITPKSLVQQQTITGTVTDAATGEPLIGVTIMIEGTNRGVITDMKGHFSINASPGEILVVSYIGMEAQKIPVGSITTINVALKASVKEIDEVVVIGYGTMRKADVTSAVTNVKKEDFLAGNIQDAAELIKGKVAGLTVTKGSGDPNAESTIRLRGITSMLGNITPLVLVDGIEGSLNSVAPENIESIDVLKDASAAAIYGTRGANGVIIITTKSGKRQEKTDVTYAAYATMSDFYKVADFMDPTDIIYGKTAMKDMGWDTDWLAAISQKGFTQNHSLSINGGTEKTSYSTNFAYRQEKGTIRRTNNEEMKMQFDLNHWLFKDKVKLNFNLVKGIHKNDVTNAADGGVNNIYRQAVIRNPTEPIYNVDNDPLLRKYYENWIFQYYNPVAMINEHLGEYKNEWTRITGNITLEPIPGWQNNLKLSTHRTNGNTESYTTSNYYTWHTAGREGEAYKSNNNSLLNQLEFTSRYEKIIRTNHRLSVLAGYSYQYDKYESFSASNYGFFNDNYKFNNLGGGSALTNKDNPDASMGSFASDSKLIGFFGRISYGFKDKYNILASVRHEGSSKFGANHKWGTFPAVSAGWTISKESFMNSLDFVSNLKLRVGYGVTGIIAGSNYQSLVLWNYNTTSWGYFLNSKGQWVPSLEAVNNPNPDLKWEKSAEFNLGIDFGILNDRITGSVDYYDKTSSDLLYNYSVPSPPNFFTTTYANAGKMKNQGIEVTVKAIPFSTPKFQYVTSVTAYHNKNKVVSLSNDMYETKNYLDNGWAGDPVSLPTQRLEIGSHFGRYYSLKTKGLSENGLWMVQNPATGKYEEFTAAMATAESSYRQWLGTSAIPKVYLNWDNTVRYLNFDLNIQISSQLGFEIVNEQRMFYENNSIAYNRLESAADPIPIVDENGKATGESRLMSTAQSQTIVDWYYENGNFLKVDYVTLGYNFNTSRLNYVDNFRIYLSGENLLCLTKYKGLDPEMSNADIYSLGIDGRDKYPTIRSFTFGLNINFK